MCNLQVAQQGEIRSLDEEPFEVIYAELPKKVKSVFTKDKILIINTRRDE